MKSLVTASEFQISTVTLHASDSADTIIWHVGERTNLRGVRAVCMSVKAELYLEVGLKYGQNGSWWLALCALHIGYDENEVGWHTWCDIGARIVRNHKLTNSSSLVGT